MADANEPKKKSGLMGIIKAAAFVLVIVVVQIVAAKALIPSPHDTEQLAQQVVAAKMAQESLDESETDETHPIETAVETTEVNLGRYNVTHYNPESDSTLNVDFDLWGVVLAVESGEFEDLYKQHERRIREQVIMTIRSVSSAEVADPGLGLIKRKILEKTNRALGMPLLREVLISKFNYVER